MRNPSRVFEVQGLFSRMPDIAELTLLEVRVVVLGYRFSKTLQI